MNSWIVLPGSGAIHDSSASSRRSSGTSASTHRFLAEHQHGLAKEGLLLEARVERKRNVIALEGDRQVELTEPEPRQALLRLELDEPELDVGVLSREGDDRRRHKLEPGRRKRADPQHARAPGDDRLQVGLRAGELGEDRLRSRDERPAGVRQLDAAARALDQRDARLVLEGGDLLGHSGGREGERPRRGGERAVERDLAKHGETANVEHQESLPPSSAIITCATRLSE